MNDMEKLISAIVDTNNDGLFIKKGKFLNNQYVKDIIIKYGFKKREIDRLLELANKLSKHYNAHLKKVQFSKKEMVKKIFDGIVCLNDIKMSYIINLIDKYCYCKVEMIASEKILDKYINRVLDNDFSYDDSIRFHFYINNNETRIDVALVDKYNLSSLIKKNLLPYSYRECYVEQDVFKFIICSLDRYLTNKQMDYISNKIIKINKYKKFNKIENLIVDSNRIFKKIKEMKMASNVLRIRYGYFKDYSSEIYPLILYGKARKDVMRIKYTGQERFKSSHDGEFITTGGKKLVEVTSVAYDKEESNNMKMLNVLGIISGDPRYEKEEYLIDDLVEAIDNKTSSDSYCDDTTLLIDGLNISFLDIEDMKHIIEEVRSRIKSTGVFSRIDFIIPKEEHNVQIYSII